MSKQFSRYYVLVLLSGIFLSGCSNDMSGLKNEIATIKASTPEDIEPIPEVKVYEKYAYQSGLLRSPFAPDEDAASNDPAAQTGDGPRPNANRNKEFLEQFAVDSLDMVGTLDSRGASYALVKTNDGLIHQIGIGNYIGLNDGQVIKITEAGIDIRELVPDGLGGYVYRENNIPLKESS